MVFCCYTTGPNSAIVKSGACLSKPSITPGGFALVIPCLQQAEYLDLNVFSMQIVTRSVYSQEGIQLSVTSTAQARIGRHRQSLELAAGQFLNRHQNEIAAVAVKTFEGHQRAIIGTLTVEEIVRDRQKFNKAVREVAGIDVGNLGLEIVSFTIKEVSDDEGYLSSLGKKRIAEVKRDARIGEAEASADAGIKESEAKHISMNAFYESETFIAESRRNYEGKQAEFDTVVLTEKAKAELAAELQSAIVRQRIAEENKNIELVVRQKEISLQAYEISRKEYELESKIIKPSEAESYRIQVVAQGQAAAALRKSEGDAEGQRMTGVAKADALEATGQAEAAAMMLKGAAWKEYSEGAYMESLIYKVPEIVAKIAIPLSEAQSLTFVASGNGDVGTSRFTNEISSMIGQLPDMIEKLTGLNLAASLNTACNRPNHAAPQSKKAISK